MTLSLVGALGASTAGRAQTTAPMATPAVVVLPATNPPAALAVPASPVEPAVSAPESDTEDFSSLAEAVAAHDSGEMDEAIRCLAGAIYFESKGEPLAGQLAVAEVILNRAKSGRFPADVCGVVKQRGQFSFVRGGAIPAIDESRAAYRTAIAVARVAMADAWDSPAADALYFNRPGARGASRVVKVAALGNHVFYR